MQEVKSVSLPRLGQKAVKGSRRAAGSECQRGSLEDGLTDGGRRGGKMASGGGEDEGRLMPMKDAPT